MNRPIYPPGSSVADAIEIAAQTPKDAEKDSANTRYLAAIGKAVLAMGCVDKLVRVRENVWLHTSEKYGPGDYYNNPLDALQEFLDEEEKVKNE